MKKVLIVSYVFPPMAAVGGHRALSFCKYLPRSGWTPVVFTVKGGSNLAWDDSLLDKIPDTKIYRSRTFEPLSRRSRSEPASRPIFRSDDEPRLGTAAPIRLSLLARFKRLVRLALSIPDGAIFWIPLGLLKGLRVIRREKISAIVSSSPPATAHLMASLLARLTGLPHIVDFRDLWTLNHTYHKRNYPAYAKAYDRFWERMVLKKARHVVTATAGFTRQLESHLDGLLADRVTTITNGFDYSEIDPEKTYLPDDPVRFSIFYAGSLYSDFNPVFFLRGLARWLAEHNIDQGTVRADFYGNVEADYNQFVGELGLADIVRFHGFRPRSELLTKLIKADLLLLLLGFAPECGNVIPAKTFEYLASGTQILALAPEGETVELIRRHRAGHWLCRPEPESLVALLNRLYTDWQQQPAPATKFRYIEDIDREQLVARLASVLDNVIAPSRP